MILPLFPHLAQLKIQSLLLENGALHAVRNMAPLIGSHMRTIIFDLHFNRVTLLKVKVGSDSPRMTSYKWCHVTNSVPCTIFELKRLNFKLGEMGKRG